MFAQNDIPSSIIFSVQLIILRYIFYTSLLYVIGLQILQGFRMIKRMLNFVALSYTGTSIKHVVNFFLENIPYRRNSVLIGLQAHHVQIV